MTTAEYTITVVDTLRIRGKPPGWMPSAGTLIALGVPLAVARRYAKVRRSFTVGLRKRITESRN